MTFKEKIDKILSTNTLQIDSVTELEQKIGAGSGSVLKYYKQNQSPGGKTVRKITEVLGISRHWWANGIGEIYSITQPLNGVPKEKIAEKSIDEEQLTMELWLQLKGNIEYFKKELDRAWALIDKITPDGKITVKRVTPKNR